MSQLASWVKQQQWGAPLRWVIAVLLVVAMAYVLAQTVWLLWYGPSERVQSNSKTRLDVSSSGDAPILSQSQVDGLSLIHI